MVVISGNPGTFIKVLELGQQEPQACESMAEDSEYEYQRENLFDLEICGRDSPCFLLDPCLCLDCFQQPGKSNLTLILTSSF